MNLKAQRAAALKAAQDILSAAKADNREVTEEEATQVDTYLKAVEELDVKIKAADESKARFQRIADLGPDDDGDRGEDGPAKSLGEHFVKHVGPDGFANLKNRGGYTVSAPEFKAATDPHLVPAAFAPALTEVDTTVVRTYRRPTVADLLGSGSLSGTSVTYYVEGAVEGAFTTVASGAQKPQIHIADPTAVTDSLKKIAAWWDTADEMAEDIPFWVSEVNNRGLYLLSLIEEAQLLNGGGTGTDILGLFNRVGVQTETAVAVTVGGDDNAAAIFRAITKVQTATGLSADGIIIHPTDYQNLRLSKDANGQFYGGGMFAGQYGNGGVTMQPPLWGLNTVVSAATAAGTVGVGAFKAASTVYRKGGVRVESTNSDLGKFTKDILTTRIEERIALAVRVPAAVVKVTLDNVI